jgi:hypothetical protein
MRLLSRAVCPVLVVALLAGCSGTSSQVAPSESNTSAQTRYLHTHHPVKPKWAFPANFFDNKHGPGPRYREVLAALTKPNTSPPKRGIYVNQFYDDKVYGYQDNNTANNPPACTVFRGESSAVNGVAVDHFGNLIVPIGSTYSGTHVIEIFKGPKMCGKLIGTITDPYGQASNAASYDAVNGTILVGNIFDNNGADGSLSICSLSAGCTSNLTNSDMYKVAGIALDTQGNCWASAETKAAAPLLVYFAGCTGSGKAATGFMNQDYGVLTFDPGCTLVGGPYSLLGQAVGASLNHQAMTLAVGNRTSGEVDVYYYSPSGLTYDYSFNNGLSPSEVIEGVAFNPAVRPYHPKP